MDNADVDLKILKNIIPAQGNLSFGNPELLNDKLGVKPGSVSPYALINNHEKDVNFYIDKNILNENLCNFHPLINTKTIQLRTSDFIKFIQEIHSLHVIDFDSYELINL